jgi:uncharacterized integral membrane protein
MLKGAEVIFGEKYGLVMHCLHSSSMHSSRYSMVWLVYIVRVCLVYNLWLFYIVRFHRTFQADFFGGIFVFLLQILAEFCNI